MDKERQFLVEFEPMGQLGLCPAESTLLECARLLRACVSSVCGGKGTCHSCVVQIVDGEVTEPTDSEKECLSRKKLSSGWRLACQVRILGPCRIYVPPESSVKKQRMQVDGLEVEMSIDPPVVAREVEVEPPTLSEHYADADRFLKVLNSGTRPGEMTVDEIDLEVLRHLPDFLRSREGKCKSFVRGSEVVAVLPAGSQSLGMAYDLGSTKIAAYLVDLNDGRTLACAGSTNPQTAYGDDIISRLTAAVHSRKDARRMYETTWATLNRMAVDLCAEVGAHSKDIVESTVAGNTVMQHLLLHLPVRQLARAPYVPALSAALDVKARELGFDYAPGSYLYLFPNIAGFVGGDHVSALLATESRWESGNVILMDIGTNTEISLICDGQISSVSCASGPAFEGFHIKDGMRASDGAIEHVTINGDEISYETINGSAPVGICGSGILDATAQLFQCGVIDKSGKMLPGKHHRVRDKHGQREFVLVDEEGTDIDGSEPISITQKDIREIQLAKAAISTGLEILFRKSNLDLKNIDHVFIAGAFGSYIDISNCITIGMLPDIPLKRFTQIGNAAGTGARIALLSRRARDRAGMISRCVEYIELASVPGFNDIYLNSLEFGTGPS